MTENGYVLADAVMGLEESGALILGPGGKKEALIGIEADLPRLSSSEESLVKRAKKYAMEQSIKVVLMKQTLQHQQQQAKVLQRQQALVLMCRIYVGSINFEVREDTLKTAFCPFGPIKAVSMSWDPLTQKHKGFAFVDFETPEAAQLALEQMNGTFISGRNIKVGRPSNMPQAQTIIEDIERESKDYNRIYVGGVHKDLGTDDIRSVFEAFGSIKTCELAPTVIDGRHKGYGFIEYDTLQSCLDAIASMNQFDLGGQYLRVGRSITPPDLRNTGGMDAKATAIPSASAIAAAAITAKIQALDAVATNMGVDAKDISNEEKRAREEREAEREKQGGGRSNGDRGRDLLDEIREEKEKKRKEREKERERRRSSRSRSRSRGRSRSRSRSRSRGKDKESKEAAPHPPPPTTSAAPPLPTAPPSATTTSHAAFSGNPLDRNEQQQAAIEQAKQLELQKKLMEDPDSVTLSQQENMQIKGQNARHLVMQKLMSAHGGLRESKVVCLRNMVGAEEVDESLEEEIEEECKKYGDVDNVIIYNERQSEEEDAEVFVKIFVEFSNSNGAKKAKDSLNGRFFGGRHIRAEVYDQIMYEEQDFSH